MGGKTSEEEEEGSREAEEEIQTEDIYLNHLYHHLHRAPNAIHLRPSQVGLASRPCCIEFDTVGQVLNRGIKALTLGTLIPPWSGLIYES